VVSILLAPPIAYFTYHYIRTTKRYGYEAVSTYAAVIPAVTQPTTTEYTN
jgi:hypothetical protein